MLAFLFFVASLIGYSNFLGYKKRKELRLAYAWLALATFQAIWAVLYAFNIWT